MSLHDDERPGMGDYERYILNGPTAEQLRERADIERKREREERGTARLLRDIEKADHRDTGDESDAA